MKQTKKITNKPNSLKSQKYPKAKVSSVTSVMTSHYLMTSGFSDDVLTLSDDVRI